MSGAPKKPRRGVRCCDFCGRDTAARCGICAKCLGRDPYSSPIDKAATHQRMDTPEDDYGEESGPDSVYPDSPESQSPDYYR